MLEREGVSGGRGDAAPPAWSATACASRARPRTPARRRWTCAATPGWPRRRPRWRWRTSRGATAAWAPPGSLRLEPGIADGGARGGRARAWTCATPRPGRLPRCSRSSRGRGGGGGREPRLLRVGGARSGASSRSPSTSGSWTPRARRSGNATARWRAAPCTTRPRWPATCRRRWSSRSSTGGLSHAKEEDTPEEDLERAIEAYADAGAEQLIARRGSSSARRATRSVAQPAVAGAAQAAAVVERLLDVVERLGGQPLAREHVGDAGRVGGQRLGGHAPDGLARRAPPPGGRGRRRAASSRARPRAAAAANGSSVRSSGVSLSASTPWRSAATSRAPAGRGVLAHAEHRHHHVLARQLQVHVVALAHEPGQLVAAVRRCRARRSPAAAGRRRTRPGAPASRSSSTSRPGHARAPPSRVAARAAERLRRAARARCTAALPPGRVERAAEQRARARGLDQRHAAVHDLLLEQVAVAEVDHRRLGEAAHDLVRARHHEVGARARARAAAARRGRRGARPRPRPPPAARRGRGPPRPARPRRPPRRSRWATPPSPRPRPGSRASARSSASGVMQWAMCSSGSSSGATNVGRSPESTSASIVLEWALRWTITSRPRCARVSSATWLPCDAPFTRNQRAGRPTPRPPGPGPAGTAWAPRPRRCRR